MIRQELRIDDRLVDVLFIRGFVDNIIETTIIPEKFEDAYFVQTTNGHIIRVEKDSVIILKLTPIKER